MKLKLPTVTLVIIDCVNYGEAMAAIRKSMHQCDFAKAIFLTDVKAYNPRFPFDIVKIDKISSKLEYSRFIIKELDKHFDTDFVLVCQHDGYVLDGNAWDDEFYDYDYIGAPWLEIDGMNVGNGGFSLRSKKLQNILATDDFIQMNHSAEDVIICRIYRPYLEEKYGIKFAPVELADKFSFELREPICKTFGFHGKFHEPFKPSVVIKRTGALGDCIMIEPLLKYYYDNGYKVYIDMPLHIAMMYSQHHYPVFHITQLTDKRVPYTLIDLDGAYEEKPKQLHLQSYYEKAGITDGVIRNAKLNFQINDQNRLFKKYIVIHNDIRDQPYRNIYGIEWEDVVEYLQHLGYTVFQVGMSQHKEIENAIQMKTLTINLLMYLVAGADMFIGIDSGISNMAVSFDVPSIIFSGSVNPEYIYPDLSKVSIIHNHPCCDLKYCWHESITTTGQPCIVNEEEPPCTQYKQEQVMTAIKQMLGIKEMKSV